MHSSSALDFNNNNISPVDFDKILHKNEDLIDIIQDHLTNIDNNQNIDIIQQLQLKVHLLQDLQYAVKGLGPYKAKATRSSTAQIKNILGGTSLVGYNAISDIGPIGNDLAHQDPIIAAEIVGGAQVISGLIWGAFSTVRIGYEKTLTNAVGVTKQSILTSLKQLQEKQQTDTTVNIPSDLFNKTRKLLSKNRGRHSPARAAWNWIVHRRYTTHSEEIFDKLKLKQDENKLDNLNINFHNIKSLTQNILEIVSSKDQLKEIQNLLEQAEEQLKITPNNTLQMLSRPIKINNKRQFPFNHLLDAIDKQLDTYLAAEHLNKYKIQQLLNQRHAIINTQATLLEETYTIYKEFDYLDLKNYLNSVNLNDKLSAQYHLTQIMTTIEKKVVDKNKQLEMLLMLHDDAIAAKENKGHMSGLRQRDSSFWRKTLAGIFGYMGLDGGRIGNALFGTLLSRVIGGALGWVQFSLAAPLFEWLSVGNNPTYYTAVKMLRNAIIAKLTEIYSDPEYKNAHVPELAKWAENKLNINAGAIRKLQTNSAKTLENVKKVPEKPSHSRVNIYSFITALSTIDDNSKEIMAITKSYTSHELKKLFIKLCLNQHFDEIIKWIDYIHAQKDDYAKRALLTTLESFLEKPALPLLNFLLERMPVIKQNLLMNSYANLCKITHDPAFLAMNYNQTTLDYDLSKARFITKEDSIIFTNRTIAKIKQNNPIKMQYTLLNKLKQSVQSTKKDITSPFAMTRLHRDFGRKNGYFIPRMLLAAAWGVTSALISTIFPPALPFGIAAIATLVGVDAIRGIAYGFSGSYFQRGNTYTYQTIQNHIQKQLDHLNLTQHDITDLKTQQKDEKRIAKAYLRGNLTVKPPAITTVNTQPKTNNGSYFLNLFRKVNDLEYKEKIVNNYAALLNQDNQQNYTIVNFQNDLTNLAGQTKHDVMVSASELYAKLYSSNKITALDKIGYALLLAQSIIQGNNAISALRKEQDTVRQKNWYLPGMALGAGASATSDAAYFTHAGEGWIATLCGTVGDVIGTAINNIYGTSSEGNTKSYQQLCRFAKDMCRLIYEKNIKEVIKNEKNSSHSTQLKDQLLSVLDHHTGRIFTRWGKTDSRKQFEETSQDYHNYPMHAQLYSRSS